MRVVLVVERGKGIEGEEYEFFIFILKLECLELVESMEVLRKIKLMYSCGYK